MKRKREQKEGESEISQKEIERICPVCGEQINETDLPDVRGVVEENLYYAGGVCIVDSEVLFLGSCGHRCEGIDVSVEGPHAIEVVVKGLFDSWETCVHFEVTDIRAAGW